MTVEPAAPPAPASGGLRALTGGDEGVTSELLAGLGTDPQAVRLGEVDRRAGDAVPTGVDELDRVLGGGLVPGSVTLVGGEPGIGKSTLLLQTLASLAGRGTRVLLVSAEESEQVRRRAGRAFGLPGGPVGGGSDQPPWYRGDIEQVKPQVVVVDSIQTVWDPSNDAAPGSVTQVRWCCADMTLLAKRTGLTVVLVGHVTKDGALAGPRTLEHLVDTVLSFEGDRHHALRLLRAVERRFGPTGELGVFEMAEEGLRGVADASGLFLGDRRCGEPGSTVFPSWRASVRCWLESRRWWRRAAVACAEAGSGWTEPVWVSWRLSSTGGPESTSVPLIFTRRRPEGPGWPSREPTWLSACRWRRPRWTSPCRRTWW